MDFGELCALVIRVRQRLQESLRAELAQAFLERDVEGTGTLNKSKMYDIMEQLGFLKLNAFPDDPDHAKREVMAEITEASQGGDMELDFNSFEVVVQRVR